jgi:hypothetical protein
MLLRLPSGRARRESTVHRDGCDTSRALGISIVPCRLRCEPLCAPIAVTGAWKWTIGHVPRTHVTPRRRCNDAASPFAGAVDWRPDPTSPQAVMAGARTWSALRHWEKRTVLRANCYRRCDAKWVSSLQKRHRLVTIALCGDPAGGPQTIVRQVGRLKACASTPQLREPRRRRRVIQLAKLVHQHASFRT